MTVRTFAYPLLLVGTWIIGEPRLSPAPFTMRVVDAQTGRGVHGLRVTTDSGIVCYSLPDGTLMGRAFESPFHQQRAGAMETPPYVS